MTPRIEMAEILSFRLKVPRSEIEGLPTSKGLGGLRLAVSSEGHELVVSVIEGDSNLRFRAIGAEVVLTDVTLAKDDRGNFFQRVLGPLMVRHGGDLHARLTWNTPERNANGEYAEVKISRGRTTYPGLNQANFAAPPSLGAGGEAGPDDAAEDVPDDSPSPEELEIRELLAKAKNHWDEYQRLKAKKG